MDNQNRKKRLADIAKEAGVSISTVSRALNGNPRISRKTSEHILKIAEKHKVDIFSFKSKKRNKTLSYILYTRKMSVYEHPFFIKSMKGAYSYAKSRNYSLNIHFCDNRHSDLEIAKEIIGNGKADGIILSTIKEDEGAPEFLSSSGFPFSMIGRSRSFPDTLWVDNDNFNAACQITSFYLNQGYSDIIYAGRDHSYLFAEDRLTGFKQAFTSRGIQCPENKVILAESDNWEEELKEKLTGEKWNALIAEDDQIAQSIILNQNTNTGKVTGFNSIPYLEQMTPGLTLLDIRPEELGKWAAKLLIDSLEGSSTIRNQLIPINTDIV